MTSTTPPWLEPYLETPLDEACAHLESAPLSDDEIEMIPTSLLFIYERSDPRVRVDAAGDAPFTPRARALIGALARNPNVSPNQLFTLLTTLDDSLRGRGLEAEREAIYALEAVLSNPAWPFWSLTGEVDAITSAMVSLQTHLCVEIADGEWLDPATLRRWDALLRSRLPYLLAPDVLRARYPKRFLSLQREDWRRTHERLIDDLRTITDRVGFFRWSLLNLLLHEEVPVRAFGLRTNMPRLLPALAEAANVPPSFCDPADTGVTR